MHSNFTPKGEKHRLTKTSHLRSTARSLSTCGLAACIAVAWASSATAQDQVASPEDADIIVTGTANRQLLLDAKTETGSRLGLTARETPATVDILSQRQIQELGARTQVEALNRAPGVTASLTATSPGIPTLRGFSGGAVGLFYDGGRVATPALFTRATDSWLYDRIEILKGPASVLFGEGALAGAINLVPKRPRLGDASYSALAAFGSFDTLRVAGDVNMPLGDKVAVRALGSYGRTSGYVDDTQSDFLATSFAVQLRPVEALNIDLAIDYSEDSYDVADYGTPLIPLALARRPSNIVSTANGLVVDRALRDTNFNVTDGILDSDTLWLRSRVRYDIAGGVSFTNELNKYHSDRRFINAEIFTFNPRSGLIDRTSGIITHDIDYWIERAFVAADFNIGGLRNRLNVGGEYSDLDFGSQRYFGNATSVDPFAPVRGTFPGGSGAPLPPRNSFAEVKVRSVFGENALNLTPKWLLLGGARYDWVDLDRRTIAASGAVTPFARDYKALSWRVGTVYDLLPKTQVFAQYSRAIAPVGNLILLSFANSRFDLTTGRSAEGGIKSSFWGDRIDVTISGYWIEQDNIITRDPANPTLSIQGGRQSSRGVELSLSAAVTKQFRVDANYTALDARFDELIEAGGVSRKGNTPPRVPETVANLFGFYSFENAPVTLSAGIRRAGRFFTDNANAIRVKGYTSLDAAIGYKLGFGTVTLRGRNLTNEFYADYTDVNPSQFQIAPPRSVDLTLTANF